MMKLPAGQEWVFDMVNNILIEVLGTIAEQEHVTIRQRQRKGIAAAKARGKHFGRPHKEYTNLEQVLSEWHNGGISAISAMKQLEISKTQFYRIVKKRYGEVILMSDNIFLRAAARIKSIISAASPGKLYKSEKSAVQTGLSCRSAAIHLLSVGRAFRSGTR